MATYKIIRFYKREDLEKEIIETGLTLEDALVHCLNPETNSKTCRGRAGLALTEKYGDWFDGYEEE